MSGVATYSGMRAGFGTNFAQAQPSTGTLGTLLATIPANPRRACLTIQNQSAGDLTVVMDEGGDIGLSTIILTGVGAGMQGAEWETRFFIGRVRIYGASGARFDAREF